MKQLYVKCLGVYSNTTQGKVYPVIKKEADIVYIIGDNGRQDLWLLVEGEFELVPCPEEIKKDPRRMKFSSKPGSAVVTYDTGATFHISRLTSIELFKDGEEVLVDVTRTYTKDGLIFQERVGIPVNKFVKVVWVSPGNEEVVPQDVTITYDKTKGSLVYGMSFYADVIDFT